MYKIVSYNIKTCRLLLLSPPSTDDRDALCTGRIHGEGAEVHGQGTHSD